MRCFVGPRVTLAMEAILRWYGLLKGFFGEQQLLWKAICNRPISPSKGSDRGLINTNEMHKATRMKPPQELPLGIHDLRVDEK